MEEKSQQSQGQKPTEDQGVGAQEAVEGVGSTEQLLIQLFAMLQQQKISPPAEEKKPISSGSLAVIQAKVANSLWQYVLGAVTILGAVVTITLSFSARPPRAEVQKLVKEAKLSCEADIKALRGEFDRNYERRLERLEQKMEKRLEVLFEKTRKK